MNKTSGNKKNGQILVEILLAMAILVIIAVAAVQTTSVSLNSVESTKERSQALELAKEAMETVESIRDYDEPTGPPATQGWNRIYCPPDGNFASCGSKGSSSPSYKTTVSGSNWILQSGGPETPIAVGNENYNRDIFIENVCRDNTTNNIASTSATTTCPGGQTEDSSTQKITVKISKSGMTNVTISKYISRSRNDICPQTNWTTAGGGQIIANPAPCYNNTGYGTQTNIDTTGTPGSLKLTQ